MTPRMTLRLPRPLPRPLAAALVAGCALTTGCVPVEPAPRVQAAPRDIPPSRVTLMLLESRDSDFDLNPDTFVIDVVLFNEFESPLPVRPLGAMQFLVIGSEGEQIATWDVDQESLTRVQRRTALGLDGYRLTLSLRAAGANDDDIRPQAARLQARFTPAAGGAPATGETPVRLGLAQ